MGSERLLREQLTPQALAERRRVSGILAVVMDALIGEHCQTAHPVALAMLEGFAGEMAAVRKAIREGWDAGEFHTDRERRAGTLPVAEEAEEVKEAGEASEVGGPKVT